MPEIGVTLSLAEVYDGVAFPIRPHFVADDAEPSTLVETGDKTATCQDATSAIASPRSRTVRSPRHRANSIKLSADAR